MGPLAGALFALCLAPAGWAMPACDVAVPSVHCGRTPTAAFGTDGTLWVAFEQDGRIYVSRSADGGGEFSGAVAVNARPETIDINGENRPKIAVGPAGERFVSWTRKMPGGFNGEIRFSRSLDSGASFEPVRTINDDGLETGHRFETLIVDGGGNVYLVWIDKRDLEGARARGGDYPGAAIYFAVSRDRGASFAPNSKVADQSCECCRIAAAETAGGDVGLLYRAVFDGIVRDHAYAAIGPAGVTQASSRATWDGWRIDACPHHGPAMIASGTGEFDLAWFTNGDDRKGIFYGRFDPVTGALRNMATVSAAASAGHPSLLRNADTLLLAWKEFTGRTTDVRLIRSDDGGATWSAPGSLASTAGASDHPFLLYDDGRAYLSWHTGDEGLRIVEIGGDARGALR